MSCKEPACYEGCEVVGATSSPTSPLWISSHISPLTSHVPLDPFWNSPPLSTLPQLSPTPSHHFLLEPSTNKYSDLGFKEKYLSDAAVSTPLQHSPFSMAGAEISTKSPRLGLSKLSRFPEPLTKEHELGLVPVDDYQRLVGDWQYFVIHLKVPIKGRLFGKSLMCLRLGGSHLGWYFLMHQVFEIVFPGRARSSVRLRMEFLKIHDMKVADYHLVHKLKEKGCTKLHTGTLKLVRYIDLLRLIISMTLSSRFQTGGSQKSKDAIEEHKRLVDRIVLHLDSETLFNRKFIRRLLSDPDVIGKLLNKADQTAG